jgi:glutamate synthase (NADPH) small chain
MPGRPSEALKGDNSLPAICGRVCPQETQCEALCVVGCAARAGGHRPPGALRGRLGGWATIRAAPRGASRPRARRWRSSAAARQGSPAPATWPAMGHQVTIFESLHAPGGVLIYGIPEFRLPKDVVRAEWTSAPSMGVD